MFILGQISTFVRLRRLLKPLFRVSDYRTCSSCESVCTVYVHAEKKLNFAGFFDEYEGDRVFRECLCPFVAIGVSSSVQVLLKKIGICHVYCHVCVCVCVHYTLHHTSVCASHLLGCLPSQMLQLYFQEIMPSAS